jgi:hypothetical protein
MKKEKLGMKLNWCPTGLSMHMMVSPASPKRALTILGDGDRVQTAVVVR